MVALHSIMLVGKHRKGQDILNLRFSDFIELLSPGTWSSYHIFYHQFLRHHFVLCHVKTLNFAYDRFYTDICAAFQGSNCVLIPRLCVFAWYINVMNLSVQ